MERLSDRYDDRCDVVAAAIVVCRTDEGCTGGRKRITVLVAAFSHNATDLLRLYVIGQPVGAEDDVLSAGIGARDHEYIRIDGPFCADRAGDDVLMPGMARFLRRELPDIHKVLDHGVIVRDLPDAAVVRQVHPCPRR